MSVRCVVVACVLLAACSNTPEPPQKNVSAESDAYWQDQRVNQVVAKPAEVIVDMQAGRVAALEQRVNQLEKDRAIDAINGGPLP